MKRTPVDMELAFSGATRRAAPAFESQLVLVDDTDIANGAIPGQMSLTRSPYERDGFQLTLGLDVRPAAALC